MLRNWDWPARRPGLAQAVADVAGYLERHAHRMEYPECLAEGWCIGSGAVESACKTVVGQRLKLAGMRLGGGRCRRAVPPAGPVPQREGQWEAFWNRDYTPN